MTFLSELARLREAATKDFDANFELRSILFNHSEAIEGLVRAAESIAAGTMYTRHDDLSRLRVSLEKLNRSE